MNFFNKITVLILVLIALSSCDISKKALKTKTDRTVSEMSEIKIKRKGDTVFYSVPKVTYKDTTIYTVNKQGTTLRTVYNDSGNVSQIECFSSLIDITERNSKLMEEFIKDKAKEKTEEFDSSVILYGFLGLGIIIIIAAFSIFHYLKKGILVR